MKIKYLVVMIIFCLLNIIVTFINYVNYTETYNEKIIGIVDKVLTLNPELDSLELINILQSEDVIDEDVLSKYGFTKDDLNLLNSNVFSEVITLNFVIFVIVIMVIFIYDIKKRKSIKKNIDEITNYLKEINKMNYKLELNTNSEDDFSKLKNEIYKTTIKLKESSEILKEDKILLKNNIVDISHQLKTPLTSISIMLDNIIEDKDMEESIRAEFLKDIKEKIININFLVLNLLKLSKFDANVIEMKKDKVLVSDIIDCCLNNLEFLIFEKNIKIVKSVTKDIVINVDFNWQVEALTNILKNAIEHSFADGVIEILVNDNNFYTKLIIKDNGSGIEKNELKKVFNRFYKGDSSNSIGVGLNLAQTIINKDNGFINVNSEKNKFTCFEIKYMK